MSRSPYRHNRYVLRVVNPKDITAIEMANIYNEDPRVRYASPGFIVLNAYCSIEPPDDTYFDEQWGLHNDGNTPAGGTVNADVNAPEGWDIHTGSSETVIAIIDSGVDIEHDDLAANMWTNSDEQEGDGNSDGWPGIEDEDDDDDGLIDEDSNGREPGDPGYDNDLANDDDENGYIDDMDGWDFVNADNDPRPVTPTTQDYHGTACAGLAAAVTNNGEGVAGVSWASKIMALRASTYVPAAVGAIDYAAANGADVISWSGKTEPNPDVADAIAEAKTAGRDGKGCVIVCAAGNGRANYPASLDETIAVGATDANDERWSYSVSASWLNVMAPSGYKTDSIIFWTTDITGDEGLNIGDEDEGDAAGDYSKWFEGTSAAAPQVAGLAALILSVNSSLTSDEVQFIIESTAYDLGVSGRDDYYGWGRIEVGQALIRASDYSLFRIQDSDGVAVADFDNYGNLFLKGSLTKLEREDETRPSNTEEDDEFIVQDSTGNLAVINGTTGDMEIWGYLKLDSNNDWVDPDPDEDEFIIHNDEGDPVAYIDELGDLYLKGRVYEQ